MESPKTKDLYDEVNNYPVTYDPSTDPTVLEHTKAAAATLDDPEETHESESDSFSDDLSESEGELGADLDLNGRKSTSRKIGFELDEPYSSESEVEPEGESTVDDAGTSTTPTAASNKKGGVRKVKAKKPKRQLTMYDKVC